MFKELGFESAAPLSLTSLLINLLVGIVLSVILRWHFRRFGSTLSNREEFAQVFPFILLTTVLIISIVKSSLALSLGLVGALSIVRFRTPIKEPEELAYLFVAIAMGLGLGAAQTIPTVIASLTILAAMALLKRRGIDNRNKNLYLSINCATIETQASGDYLEQLNNLIGKHAISSDLRRFDTRDKSTEAVYFIDVAGPTELSALVNELNRTFPDIGVTFLDQSQLPSV
jgi:hypothetical protein